MKNNIKTALLLCLCVLPLNCCNKENPIDKDEITYDGINLHYNASDSNMTAFLNDFTHRNMRYDSESCGEFAVTNGTGFAKNWEAMAVTFQNAVKQVYREDKIAKIANYLTIATQDGQGMIYNTPMAFEPAFSKASYDLTGYCVPQGWPFPSWVHSVSNILDYGSLEATHTTEFNFNDVGNVQSQNWYSSNGNFEIGHGDHQTGYGYFSTEQSIGTGASFKFYRTHLDTLLPVCEGIDTRYAPMVDIEIGFTGKNVKDYGIYFKVAGDDTEYFAPQSEYASTPIENLNTSLYTRQFFDMYLLNDWNRKIITEIGVKFIPVEGKKMSITDGTINFLRPSYDTRQSNATYQWILALYNYFVFTRDMSTLNLLINKARKAILFLTHALEGENGLLSLEYFYGHDGIVPYSISPVDRLAYHGIGNGYWDLTVSPMRNLEANTYFYQALKAMAVLEDAVKDTEANDISNVYIKNRLPYEEKVYYHYDADSLNELAALVKSNMERNIEVVAEENTAPYTAGDYHYVNKGGFWNPETGRFALGINEYNGDIHDYGYVYLNLELICAGIGTEEQQLSVMKWIDGQRIVESDTSKGEDIYFYEFAPRYNTLKDNDALGFARDENFYYRFYRDGYELWSRQLQDGGAAIAWSYYDLVARSKVLGVENALKRLDEIKKWYLKVLAYGGSGLDFYDAYYDDIQYQHEEEDYEKWYMVYSVQDAINKGGGALGLDAEFIESVILIRAIPDALYGMDASVNNTLTFTYKENNLHDYFEIYNMKYGDTVYSIRSKKNVMEVFNICGVVDHNHNLTFKYKTTNENLKVTVNGVQFTDTQYIDGYIHVTVPFGNVKVIFG